MNSDMTIFVIYPYGMAFGMALSFSDYDGLMIHTEKGYIAMGGGGITWEIIQWSAPASKKLYL